MNAQMREAIQKDSTRDSLLDCAAVLFADYGFEGTSVREIAKLAKVNLAAINYHFKSKENLYWEVFNRNYHWLSSEIDKLGKESESTLDFCLKLFDFFKDNSSPLMNSFKIILTNNPKLFDSDVTQGKVLGPPGWETLLAVITKDKGNSLGHEQKEWIMRILFTHIVHGGIMMATSLYKQHCTELPQFTIEQKREDITKLVTQLLG